MCFHEAVYLPAPCELFSDTELLINSWGIYICTHLPILLMPKPHNTSHLYTYQHLSVVWIFLAFLMHLNHFAKGWPLIYHVDAGSETTKKAWFNGFYSLFQLCLLRPWPFPERRNEWIPGKFEIVYLFPALFCSAF